jgi:cbb3-type cytochrome oxidase subunit 3
MGVWEGGCQTGDTIGLIVWFILLFCVVSVFRKDKRTS